MPSLTLELDNRLQIAERLAGDTWIVACLCAAWCDVCNSYRAGFNELAAQHPDKCIIWIDVEDQADVVGDLEIENFPTLLIQRNDTVAFFGTVQPDLRLTERLMLAQVEKSDAELHAEAGSSTEHKNWQLECNLRQRLNEAMGI